MLKKGDGDGAKLLASAPRLVTIAWGSDDVHGEVASDGRLHS